MIISTSRFQAGGTTHWNAHGLQQEIENHKSKEFLKQNQVETHSLQWDSGLRPRFHVVFRAPINVGLGRSLSSFGSLQAQLSRSNSITSSWWPLVERAMHWGGCWSKSSGVDVRWTTWKTKRPWWCWTYPMRKLSASSGKLSARRSGFCINGFVVTGFGENEIRGSSPKQHGGGLQFWSPEKFFWHENHLKLISSRWPKDAQGHGFGASPRLASAAGSGCSQQHLAASHPGPSSAPGGRRGGGARAGADAGDVLGWYGHRCDLELIKWEGGPQKLAKTSKTHVVCLRFESAKTSVSEPKSGSRTFLGRFWLGPCMAVSLGRGSAAFFLLDVVYLLVKEGRGRASWDGCTSITQQKTRLRQYTSVADRPFKWSDGMTSGSRRQTAKVSQWCRDEHLGASPLSSLIVLGSGVLEPGIWRSENRNLMTKGGSNHRIELRDKPQETHYFLYSSIFLDKMIKPWFS